MTSIGFIGFGLIGGSIAKALRTSTHSYTISAYNRYYPESRPSQKSIYIREKIHDSCG